MLLCEFIETRDTYRAAYLAIMKAFQEAVSLMSKYQEGDYWAGEFLDSLRTHLEPVILGAVDPTLRRRVIVRTPIVEISEFAFSMHAGGRVRDMGHSVYFDINVPKRWIDNPNPRMLHYLVRDNGKEWANMLARVIVHELLHLHQIARGERSLSCYDPAGINRRINVRKKGVAGAKGYLFQKDEIDAQALSAALELIDWLGVDRTLALFRDIRGLEKYADYLVSPHLTQYWDNVRTNIPAWRAFLKSLYRHVIHYKTTSADEGQ